MKIIFVLTFFIALKIASAQNLPNCPDYCPPKAQQACGMAADGTLKTFDNRCQLVRANCLNVGKFH